MTYILLTILAAIMLVLVTDLENWPLGVVMVVFSSIYWPMYLA